MNGLFNTGLLAVGPSGSAFLDWWVGWLARDCLREGSAGMWVDQLWIDWAPIYFEHLIVRDSSLNVGYWNLDERELSESDGTPTIDGAPLRHFHFVGFDPRRPELLSIYSEELGDYIREVLGRDLPAPSSSPSSPVCCGSTANACSNAAARSCATIRTGSASASAAVPSARGRGRSTGKRCSPPRHGAQSRRRTRSIHSGPTSSSGSSTIPPLCAHSRPRRRGVSTEHDRPVCRLRPSAA